MRIAHVVASYYPRRGEVETHVRRIAEACAVAGDQVTVLTHATGTAPPAAEVGGVRVLRFPGNVRSLRSPLSLPFLRYLVTHPGDFDVVHAHGYYTLAGHAAARSGLPFVFTPHYHGTGRAMAAALVHRLYRPAGVWVLANADAVICTSRGERDLIVGDFLTVARKIRVIREGTDLSTPSALTSGEASATSTTGTGQAWPPSWSEAAAQTRELYAWVAARGHRVRHGEPVRPVPCALRDRSGALLT
jgi:glycosyltransferase involved in cell wall biosynthesis